jgi:hypothetical protein
MLRPGEEVTIPAWRVERTRDEMLIAPTSKVEMGFRARCKVRFRNLNPRAQRAVNPCTVRYAWFDVCSVQFLTLATGRCGGVQCAHFREHEITRRLFWNWYNCKNRAQRAAYKFSGGPIRENFELSTQKAIEMNRPFLLHAEHCPICRGTGKAPVSSEELLDAVLFGETP